MATYTYTVNVNVNIDTQALQPSIKKIKKDFGDAGRDAAREFERNFKIDVNRIKVPKITIEARAKIDTVTITKKLATVGLTARIDRIILPRNQRVNITANVDRVVFPRKKINVNITATIDKVVFPKKKDLTMTVAKLTINAGTITINGATSTVGNAGASSGANAGSLFLRAFQGAFIGAIAGAAFSFLVQLPVKLLEAGAAAIQAAGDFEVTTNALKVFTGSTRLAKKELQDIEDLATNTPGLRLVAAQEGYQQLRALGFGAQQAKGFIKELGEEKILSGASDESLQRVIFNFAQIRSGGQKVSQELRELLTQMPTLQRAFQTAFGTLDPAKIQKFFDADVDDAFKRLTDAMSNSEAAAGGFNDAWGKATDAFIKAGREFGEPILEPLTKDLQRLSVFIDENKEAIQDWGQTTADVYRGLVIAIEAFDTRQDTFLGKATGRLISLIELGTYFRGSLLSTLDDLAEAGEGRRLLQQRAKQSGVYGAKTKEQIDGENEQRVIREQADLALLQQEQKAIKERLEIVKSYYDEKMSIIDSNQRLELAQLDNQIAYTLEQEQELVNKRAAIQDKYLRQQFAETQELYKELLGNTALTNSERIILENEASQKLRGIYTQLHENELKRQKDFAEKQRQIEEKLRQDKIASLDLLSREYKQSYDVRVFDLQRAIDNETISAENGYDQLLQITNDSLDFETQRIRDEYDLRLQDKSLTNQEIINLERERDLEILGLQEETRRKAIDIENKKYDAIERRLERNLGYVKDYYSGLTQISSQISDVFFNTSSFNSDSFNAFGNIFGDKQNIDALEADVKRYTDSLAKLNEEAISGKVLPTATEAIKDNIKNVSLLMKTTTANLEDARNAIDPTTREILKLGDALTKTLGTYENFDKIAKISMQDRHRLERESLEKEAEVIKKLIQLEKDRAIAEKEKDLEFWQRSKTDNARLGLSSETPDKMIEMIKNDLIDLRKDGVIPTTAKTIELEERLRKLGLTSKSLNIQQTKEEMDLFKESIEGLNAEIKALSEGDISVLNRLFDGFNKENLTEQKNTLIEIRRLEYDLANPDLNAANEQKLAILQKMVDMRNQEADALTRIEIAELEIANQDKYSPNQDRANVLEFLAQQKNVTELLSDAKINTITKAYDGLDAVIGKLTKRFGVFGDTVKDLLTGLIKLALNKVFQQLFGGGSGKAPQLFGGGNGTGGIGQTPNFNPLGGSGNFGANSPTGAILTLPNGQQVVNVNGNQNGASVLSDGTIDFSSIRNTIPSSSQVQAQGIGGSGGFNLSSGIGLASGAAMMIGGQIGGIGGSALQYGGMGALLGLTLGAKIGSIGGPLGAAIGAGIGVVGGLIAGIVGKSAKRRREEKQREKAIGDAFKAIDKLIEQVNNDQIDGNQAIEQADNIRTQYVEAMSELTDKKTRNHALKDVARIDAKIEQLKTAVGSQNARRQRLELFAPTFADGGSLSKFANDNFRHNPLGYQRGGQKLGYFPASKEYAIFNERGSEYIFDAETTRNIGTDKLDLIRSTKGQALNSMLFRWNDVQHKAEGGSLTVINSPTTANASQAQMQPIINLHFDSSPLGQALASALSVVIQQNNGSAKQLQAISQGLENNGQNKLVEVLAELVREKLNL